MTMIDRIGRLALDDAVDGGAARALAFALPALRRGRPSWRSSSAFHAVWMGEHRVWYDGWCPAPLHALAEVAGATSRIHLGTAMYLVPQHDPSAAARSIATLDHLSGGRIELGAGLGYRDAEFDALGLRRDRRGKLMDANLDVMEAVWRG